MRGALAHQIWKIKYVIGAQFVIRNWFLFCGIVLCADDIIHPPFVTGSGAQEGPGLGGAMLAAVACGEYASVQEAADKIVKVVGTEKPDAALITNGESNALKNCLCHIGTRRIH